jgi:hypothetical protein
MLSSFGANKASHIKHSDMLLCISPGLASIGFDESFSAGTNTVSCPTLRANLDFLDMYTLPAT